MRRLLDGRVRLVHVEGDLIGGGEELIAVFFGREDALDDLGEDLLGVADAKVEVDGFDDEALQAYYNLVLRLEVL